MHHFASIHRRLPLASLLAGALWLAQGMTSAQESPTAADVEEAEIDTSWMEDVTLLPVGEGHAEPIRPCRLNYKLSWRKLLGAGEAVVEIGRGDEAGVLLGTAEAESGGLARMLYEYDCELSARVDERSLAPLGFEHSETEDDETTSYRTVFAPGRWVRTYTTKPDEDGVLETVKRTYHYGEALDLLSTILYVRSQPLADGDKITRVVQPFDKPYLVSFEVIGRESHKFDGESIPTIKLSVTILRVNKDLSLKSYDKMKENTIWVSDDDFRLPVEIRADIFIGYITCLLESREWTDDEGEAANRKPVAKPEPVPAAEPEPVAAEERMPSIGSRIRSLGGLLRRDGD